MRWVSNHNRVHENRDGWCRKCHSRFHADDIAERHNATCAAYEARIAELEAERDLYKQYYDAVIDFAVVNWTLDGLSQRDAHHAIQRLIMQHMQEVCDPQLNETLAKMQARIAELDRRLIRVCDAIHNGVNETALAIAQGWES